MMVSARDPAAQRTLEVFEQAHSFVQSLSQEDVEAARLSAFRLISPLRSEAMLTWQAALDARTGYSQELRRQFLQRLLGATVDEVQYAARYLEPPSPPSPTAVRDAHSLGGTI